MCHQNSDSSNIWMVLPECNILIPAVGSCLGQGITFAYYVSSLYAVNETPRGQVPGEALMCEEDSNGSNDSTGCWTLFKFEILS
jgi:hypothetical protein